MTTTTTRHILLNGQIIKEENFASTILDYILDAYDSFDLQGWVDHLADFILDNYNGNQQAAERMAEYQEVFHSDIQENEGKGVISMLPMLLDNYEFCCDNEAFNDMHQYWVILDIMTGGLLSKLDLTVLRVDMRDTKK